MQDKFLMFCIARGILYCPAERKRNTGKLETVALENKATYFETMTNTEDNNMLSLFGFYRRIVKLWEKRFYHGHGGNLLTKSVVLDDHTVKRLLLADHK